MEIREAELVVSAPSKAHWPESELPEIVLAGRSNVGKSSLINTLCGRKALAYVGNTPGKTRLLNFFDSDHRFMFGEDVYKRQSEGSDVSIDRVNWTRPRD